MNADNHSDVERFSVCHCNIEYRAAAAARYSHFHIIALEIFVLIWSKNSLITTNINFIFRIDYIARACTGTHKHEYKCAEWNCKMAFRSQAYKSVVRN